MKKNLFTVIIATLALSTHLLTALYSFPKKQLVILKGKVYEQLTETTPNFSERIYLYDSGLYGTLQNQARVGNTVFFFDPNRKSGEITQLKIENTYKDQGFGSYLFKLVHSRLKTYNIQTCHLKAPEAGTDSMPPNPRFYQAHGYKPSACLSAKHKELWMERHDSPPTFSSLFTRFNSFYFTQRVKTDNLTPKTRDFDSLCSYLRNQQK